MKIKSVIFILLLIGLYAPIPANAQSAVDSARPNLHMEDRKTGDFEEDLVLAIQLMKRRAFISAANLLEEMYAANPGRVEIINILLDCYLSLKADDKAELLLLKLIETYPFSLQHHDRLLELYLKGGNDSLINNQIGNILEKFPRNSDIYLLLIKKLTSHGYYERAFNTVFDGRRVFESDKMFAMETALLYETRREYYSAVKEYFKVIESDTTLMDLAERKVSVLVRYPEAPAEIIRALNDILDSLPNNESALKVLQQAYIKDNNFTEAFDICLRLDSLTEQEGRNLFQYMRQCQERKLFDQVIRTAEYIDSMNFESKPYADYKFYYARALIGLEKYDQALEVYRFIQDNYPRQRDKAEALLLTGNLYRYGLKNYDSARVYFDIVASSYMLATVNIQACYEIASLYLVEGKLDLAESRFNDLLDRYKNIEDKEKVHYQVAMISFFKKDFEGADLGFRKLMASFPRGFYVNDALINSLIIGESQLEYPQALSDYAGAVYYDARLMPDSMEIKYQSVIDLGWTPLTGLSIYKLAEFYSSSNDTVGALEIINKMENEYSEDYFYPYTAKLKGDILYNENKFGEAIEIYRNLLENYNNYPFTGELRDKMQRLEKSVPTS